MDKDLKEDINHIFHSLLNHIFHHYLGKANKLKYFLILNLLYLLLFLLHQKLLRQLKRQSKGKAVYCLKGELINFALLLNLLKIA